MNVTSASRVADVDPFSDPILEDPYDYYAQLREAGPAIHLPRYDAWAVAGYEDVRKALRDWDTFSSASGVFLTPDRNKELSGRSMITVDPPIHDQMRKVYQEHISLRPLRSVEAAIVARAESLVGQLVERGSFDAVRDLGAAFSVQTVGDYLGLPKDGREGLLVYSNAVFDTHGPLNDRHRSGLDQMPALFDYLESLSEPGCLDPEGWGAAMLAAAADGRFPEAWVKGSIASFVVAGMDTTMNAISSAVWLLAEHPDQWRSLREDPELVPRAFNEALRCESPIQWFSRQTTRACEIGNVEVPAEARVILAYAAANRDERIFEDAARFDIHRQGPGHIAFGFGVHGCVGQALARIEGNAILAALASRVESIEVLHARRHLNNALRGFGELRVAVGAERRGTVEVAGEPAPDGGLDCDFDPHEADVDGARGLYASMHREGCPVIHSERLGGFYLTASHPETRKAAADWRTYSSAAGVTLPKRPFKSAALENDPPEHGFWRDLFKEVLNLATYREFEAKIAEHCGELIAELAPRGRADLAAELGEILPVMTICEIVGVHDRERALLAREIALEVMASFGDEVASPKARERYVAFCMEEIDGRRRHPREDFLTRLATAEVEPGRMLTDAEIVSLLTGFLVAGHHTTSSLLAALFQRVATDPGLRDGLIADPALIPAAVEETLRLDTPLHGFFRRTTGATAFGDVPIAAGSEVMLNYAAANRDPTVFGCPEDFDLGRKPNPHLAFGYGIHSCPGSQLARLEARVVLEELLRRLPDLTADDGPVEIDWLGANLALIPRVPVTFTPA